MPNYDSTTLMGHLARDPESKVLDGGKRVTNFCLAVNTSKTSAIFWDCTAWDSYLGDILATYRKGMPLMVVGRHRKEEWTGNDGVEKSKITITVKEIIHVISKREADEMRGEAADPTVQPPADAASSAASDDLPF